MSWARFEPATVLILVHGSFPSATILVVTSLAAPVSLFVIVYWMSVMWCDVIPPSDPALCGSCPLFTPYYCRLGDLLCLFCVYPFCVYYCISICVILLFSFFAFSFVASPSVLWYCWLGLLTCKNRLPYNLYCVGGDVKHCTINQSGLTTHWIASVVIRPIFYAKQYCLQWYNYKIQTVSYEAGH